MPGEPYEHLTEPGVTDMNEEPVNFRMTYVQEFIPRRHRKPRIEAVHVNQPLVIRRISGEDAPVSHRIVETGGSITEVRRFGDRYFWPLLEPSGRTLERTPANAAEFESFAKKRSPYFADVLGCHFTDNTIEELTFLRGLPRLLEPAYDIYWECREGQLERAKQSANRTVICGETVWIEGGAPVYYAMEIPIRSGNFYIEAGPSTADTLRGIGIPNPYYSLAGPEFSARRFAAFQGRAFGTHEWEHERSALASQANSVTLDSRIEELLPPPTAEAGPDTCARAFAADLWRDVHEHSDDSWRERLDTLVSSLAHFKTKGFSPFVVPTDLPHRAILKDYLSLADEEIQDPYELRRNAAPAILRRLNLVDPALLAADEEVLASLGDHPSAERRSAS